MRLSALLLSLAALPAFSQVSFGPQLGFATPAGDMAKYVGSNQALNIGFQVRTKLGGGHALLPRVDFNKFSGNYTEYTSGYYGTYGTPVKAEQKTLALALDWNYFMTRRVNDGFYWSVGMGLIQKEEDYRWAETAYVYAGSHSESKTRLLLSAGIGGVIARHVDLSLRFQFFGDTKDGEIEYSNGSRTSTYANSTITTFGVAYHF